MLHHHHVFLNTLVHWAVAKATCRDCYPYQEGPLESIALTRATDLVFGLLRKEPQSHTSPKSGFYHAHLLPKLQNITRREITDQTTWTHREAYFWMTLEDRSYLTAPDFVTLETLIVGGVNPTRMPTLGITDVHIPTRRRRLLQFLFDYYGVVRTFELARRRVLRSVIHKLDEQVGDITPEQFGHLWFHRLVNNIVIAEVIAQVPVLYNGEIVVDVVVGALFDDLMPIERDFLYHDSIEYLGLTPTHTN